MGREYPLKEGSRFPGGFWVKLENQNEVHRFPVEIECVSLVDLYRIFEDLSVEYNKNNLKEASRQAGDISKVIFEKLNGS